MAGTPYDATAKTGGTTITNVAKGVNDSDAVNVAQLKEFAANGTTVVGGANVTVSSQNNATGGKDYTVAVKDDISLTSVTTGVTKMDNTGITITNADTSKNVSLTGSGLNNGGNKITNVAAGDISKDSTDAINGSQLFGMKTQIEGNTTSLGGGAKYDFTTNTYTAPTYNVTNVKTGENIVAHDVGTAIDNLNQGVTYNDNRINQIAGGMAELSYDIGKAGAQANAMAALKPMQYDPLNKTQLMAGYGTYRGKSAFAMGIAHYDQEKLMYNFGASYEGQHVGVNVGLTWKLGRRKPETIVAQDSPETITLKNRITEMQMKMDALEKKLEKLLEKQ